MYNQNKETKKDEVPGTSSTSTKRTKITGSHIAAALKRTKDEIAELTMQNSGLIAERDADMARLNEHKQAIQVLQKSVAENETVIEWMDVQMANLRTKIRENAVDELKKQVSPGNHAVLFEKIRLSDKDFNPDESNTPNVKQDQYGVDDAANVTD